MALYGSNAEYALHCLLYLIPLREGETLSARDLAELQGISPSLVAKLFTKLQRAGLVCAHEGLRGGFALARPAESISMLAVIDAVEGRKKLFDCKDIRTNFLLFGGCTPDWARRGVCDIHAEMLNAERAMRTVLAGRSIADLALKVSAKMPRDISEESANWLAERAAWRSPGARESERPAP